jgi:nucleotide-binding universal stress UspA family protein
METKRMILVPVDFSETSDRALRQAHAMAKALEKDLFLVHVIEDTGGWFGLFSKEQQQSAQETLTQRMEELVVRAEKFSGRKVRYEILRGKPYLRILEKAEELGPAYIIMGIRGQISDNAENHYVGNHASKVARAAPCPVITVSSKITCHNLRTILLPLDLTRETRQKVTNAIELAKKFGARIKVMCALWSVNDKMVVNQLKTIMNQVLNFIQEEDIECTGEIIESSKGAKSAVPIILKYAEEQGDIDMILIMTQQELGVLDFFISSNALEMLKKSPYPVMSIQPKNLEQTSIFSF